MVTTRAMKTMAKRALGWIAAAVGIAAAAPVAASTITYYHNDIAGSPVAATNSAGQVIWRESYRPYGERLTKSASAKSNDVWFTSRREDSSGLVYMGARHYDPVAGRFVSTDPKGFDEANVMSFGRYTYANDNPYKYIDPNGRNAALAYAGGAVLLIGAAYYAISGPDRQAQMRQALSDLGSRLGNLIFNEDAADKKEPSAEQVDKPKGVPDNWVERPTEDPNGKQWVNPENEGDRVRVMPGNPDSVYPNSRGPYVRDVRNGNQWLDTEGNRIEGREGKYNNDTHIPLGDYVFKP